MRKPIFMAPAAFVLPMMAAAAGAQDVPQAAGGDEIVVTGPREGTLDLKRLQRAEAVFRDKRATFAPGSTLFFQIALRGRTYPRDIVLTLRNGDTVIPVVLDAQHRFTLPALDRGTWELLHNEGKQPVAVRAQVLSPGASEIDRPLGDLRLGCRVGWELQKDEHSFVTRAGFDMIGGCSSARIGFYVMMPKPIAAATVTAGTKIIDLPVHANGVAFRAPLGDATLPNEARVRVAYRQ